MLDSWFLRLSLVEQTDKAATARLTNDEIGKSLGETADGYARRDDIRNVEIVPILTTIGSLEQRRPMCTTPIFASIC